MPFGILYGAIGPHQFRGLLRFLLRDDCIELSFVIRFLQLDLVIGRLLLEVKMS